MNTVPHDEVLVTLRVNPHADVHVVVALDQLGRFLDALEIPTTRGGYRQLLAWAGEFGIIDQVGIEGTGSYGAGLTRFLRTEGIAVVEVNRPGRQTRRHLGKSDLVDAEAAARAVLSDVRPSCPRPTTATSRCCGSRAVRPRRPSTRSATSCWR